MTTVRRFANGKTFKRSATETHGRKKPMSAAKLRNMDRVRNEIITKADGEREVTWGEIVQKSRVPTVDRPPAANHMQVELGMNPRRPRAELTRNDIDESDRNKLANKLRKLPQKYWASDLRLTMDNKERASPRPFEGKKYLKQSKVRFVIRTGSEGLNTGYTTPDQRKHSTNLGGDTVVAGIIKGKVRIWHCSGGPWDGKKATEVYSEVVAPALVRAHSKTRRHTILEDNDPTGYKPKEMKQAEADLNIPPVEFPTCSPDMNSCVLRVVGRD